jgi:hypothetical protein
MVLKQNRTGKWVNGLQAEAQITKWVPHHVMFQGGL